MKYIFIILVLLHLVGCSSALLTANNKRLTSVEKIEEIKSMDNEEVNYMWSSYKYKCWTAIDCAVKKRDYNLTKYLLERGADPNNIRHNYIFPIQRVAQDSKLTNDQRYKFLAILIKYKATPNICSSKFTNPLNSVIAKNDFRSVELLIQAGAPLAKEKRCKKLSRPSTPLKYAITSGKKDKIGHDIIKLLIFYGANVMDVEYRYNPYYTASSYARSCFKYKKAKVIDNYASQFTRRYPNYFETKKAHDILANDFINKRIATRKAREIRYKKELEYKRLHPEPVIDDSNKWYGTAVSSIAKSASSYKSSRTKKQSYTPVSTRTAFAPTTSKSTKKTKSLSCETYSKCKSSFEGKSSKYFTTFSGKGLGRTNDEACTINKRAYRQYSHCIKLTLEHKGKTGQLGPVGVSHSRCKCTSYGKCFREVKLYCAPSKSKTSKVQRE